MPLVHGASHRLGVMPHVVAAWATVALPLLAAMASGCTPSAVTAVLGRADPKDRHAEARLLFQRHCRSCHGAVGAGDGPYAAAFRTPAPDLRPIVVAAAADQDPVVRRILRGPSPGQRTENAMPAFGDILSDRQGRAIVGLIAAFADEIESQGTDGARLFLRHCVTCHGAKGMGDGPLAAELLPRPRDLTRSWYRFRSTESGGGPRHLDLVASIRRGLGVTAMGGFRALGRDSVDGVAAYLGTLTTVAANVPETETGASGAGGHADQARGRDLYTEARCWQCHGAAGRGDGPSAGALLDDAGRASLPANLTQPWRLKGGADIDSLVRTIANGMNGTPMPSYGEVLTVDELWALARYVRGLAESRPEVPVIVPVFDAAAARLRDPTAPFWQGARPTGVPLGPQGFAMPRWYRPAIDAAQVMIAASGEEIAFHLAWDDPFENRGSEDRATAPMAIDDPRQPGRWRLPDQLALQLTRVPEDGVLPPLYGGGRNAPVTRWIWSAATESLHVIESRGPNDEQSLRVDAMTATATFDEGRWQLVLARTRDDAQTRRLLPPGARMALSLRLWEGSQGEQGRRHSLSSWIPFTLPEG